MNLLTIDELSVRVRELEARCENLTRQLADKCSEVCALQDKLFDVGQLDTTVSMSSEDARQFLTTAGLITPISTGDESVPPTLRSSQNPVGVGSRVKKSA